MKRKYPRALFFLLFTFSISYLLAFTADHQASNAGDADPRTFHFIPSSTDTQLVTATGEPITNDRVKDTAFYNNANGFEIKLDGEDIDTFYKWDFSPDTDGITNTELKSSDYPAAGQFRIDTSRGRIKSNPALFWKFVTQSGMTNAAGFTIQNDATHPVLVQFGTLKKPTTNEEVIAGVILFNNSADNNYYYIRLEMTKDKENIDSYDATGSAGWKVTGPEILPLISPTDVCTELHVDTDETSATTAVGFIAWCSTKVYGWSYVDVGIWNNIVNIDNTNVNTSTAFIRHVDVAVDGSVALGAGSAAVKYVYMRKPLLVNTITSEIYWCNSGDSCVAKTPFSFEAGTPKEVDTRCADILGPAVGTDDSMYRNAFEPTIDCSGSNCFIAFIQETANISANCSTTVPGIFAKRLMASTTLPSGTVTDKNNVLVPLDRDDDIKNEPKLVAMPSGKAFIAYKQTSEATGISVIKSAYYNGTDWPRNSTYRGGGVPGAFLVTQVSNISDGVPIRQLDPNIGQNNDIYIFWTQGDSADFSPTESPTGANAQYIYFRRWRLNNINAQTKELKFDSIQKSRVEDADLTSFSWARFNRGRAYISFIQSNKLYFGLFNGISLPTTYESIGLSGTMTNVDHNKYPYAISAKIVYSNYPKPADNKPSEGRAVVVWPQKDQSGIEKIYSRAYYNAISLNVKYYAQTFGTQLKPDGGKPPLVRNNYSKPGDTRPVDIYINDQQATDTITVEIYTVQGQLVKRILDNALYNSFRQPVQWDKRTNTGSLVASGIYHVYVKSSSGYTASHPIIIVR